MSETSSQFGHKFRELDNLAQDLLLEDADDLEAPVTKVAYGVPEESFEDVLGMGVVGLLSDYVDAQGQKYFANSPDQIILVLDKVKRGDRLANRYELRLEYASGFEGDISLRVNVESDYPKVTTYIFDRRDRLDVGYIGHGVLTYDIHKEDLQDFHRLFSQYSDESNKLSLPPLY